MLVRRLSDAATTEWHSLRSRILMDAGELGSRHMTATWLELEPGTSQDLRTHEEAEQIYVVVRGVAMFSGAGDTAELGVGDLALIPPASDHSIANDGSETLALLSVGSPAVAVAELYESQSEVPAFADDDDL